MADVGPPGGDAGTPDDRMARRVPAEDMDRWIDRWRSRLPGDARIPEDEARMVVEAVLADLAGGGPEALDKAGRSWGRAYRSVTAMVGRLSGLREAFAVAGVEDPMQMHRALDRVTAAATEEALNRLERMSRTDALTGVGNRRAFDETLSSALSAASRQGHPVTVVAVDLDGLKRINDTEGHAAGDAALLALVRGLYSALRDEDTVFRVGGDEFVILLPFTSVDAAELLMRRIQVGGAPAFTWGAAGYPGDGTDARALVDAADQDLYRRRQGRRPRPAPPTPARPAALPEAARWLGRDWRWVSVPAAAVVAAVVAALVAGGGQRGPASASGPHHPQGPPPATSPSSSPAPSSGPSSASGPAGAPTASNAGGGGGSSVTGSVAPAGSSSPGGGGGGGSTPGGPGQPPPPPPSPNGGVLGTLEQALAPVPLVGGSNGLVATLGQLLTGSSSAAAGTATPKPASGPALATPTTATNATSSIRLLP